MEFHVYTLRHFDFFVTVVQTNALEFRCPVNVCLVTVLQEPTNVLLDFAHGSLLCWTEILRFSSRRVRAIT